MKFSLFVIAALAAPATASRKRKTQKKGAHGATGPTDDNLDLIPIGDPCGICAGDNGYLLDNCAIPSELDHGVCLGFFNIDGDTNCSSVVCQSGQPGAYCENTSDCVKPPGLEHPVCRKPGNMNHHHCQSGTSGADCGDTSDCVIPPGLEHGVCRNNKCQR